MEDNKPQGQSNTPLNPSVAEQLEQIKKIVPGTSQRLYEFLTENLKSIAIGCGVIILAVAVYAGVSHFRERAASKAADADTARYRIDEAQLFIDAAHSCYNKFGAVTVA